MTSEPGHVRAFVAFDIEPALRARLADVVRELQVGIKGVRWVSTGGVHLTLRFLGPSAPGQLDRLEPRLRTAAGACPAFATRIAGLGIFPERGQPRVLWVDAPLPPSALALQADCESAAVEAGFAGEKRPFRSHLTLGRWKDRAPRPALPEVDLGTVGLDTLVLFRSDLKPTGAVYTPLATFPLGRT